MALGGRRGRDDVTAARRPSGLLWDAITAQAQSARRKRDRRRAPRSSQVVANPVCQGASSGSRSTGARKRGAGSGRHARPQRVRTVPAASAAGTASYALSSGPHQLASDLTKSSKDLSSWLKPQDKRDSLLFLSLRRVLPSPQAKKALRRAIPNERKSPLSEREPRLSERELPRDRTRRQSGSPRTGPVPRLCRSSGGLRSGATSPPASSRGRCNDEAQMTARLESR